MRESAAQGAGCTIRIHRLLSRWGSEIVAKAQFSSRL